MRLEAHTLTALLLSLLLTLGATDASHGVVDPNVECQPYGWSGENTSDFPAIWNPVIKIMDGDDEGHSKYAAFSNAIPPIAAKGSGDFQGNNIDKTMTAYEKANDYSDPDCWWTDTACVTPKLAGLTADIATVPEPNTLGLSYDDGPNCTHNIFYDFLATQNQKATFFYIGSNVMDWPLEAQRGVVDGHQVCVHTWSHSYLTAMSNESVFAELWYTQKAIREITGITPTCWRPPYGDVDDRVRFIAKQMGLGEPCLWEYDSNDWDEGTDGYTPAKVQANYNKLITKAQAGKFNASGAIMLTHELNNFTMQIAMDNHQNLSKVFKLVPIATALNQTNPCEESGKRCRSPIIQESLCGALRKIM
ncbi:carbohydrate esterase family 4 protein [Roridomyces roridus]|uniref:chitin deacetylase n=1 Tax=Roridomyces roridus TaxID=1738132 RepID=A0AAD7FK76_9AGAR|nr:carbohydrate esterase family 4 protein [Roridomyces roridus]